MELRSLQAASFGLSVLHRPHSLPFHFHRFIQVIPTRERESCGVWMASSRDENSEPLPEEPNPLVNAPLVCFLKFAGESAAGALIGSVFGFGLGLTKNKGLKGSFPEAASSAKTCAVLTGVHSLMMCLLKGLRGKDDVINAGLAGCCTGLALSYPGPPQAMVQSCLTFGVFSFMIERLREQRMAQAHPLSENNGNSSSAILPPLTLPLPSNLAEGFSTFYQSLEKKPRKGTKSIF